jgi:hypothetical protein
VGSKCEDAQSTDGRWAIADDVSISVDGTIIANKERGYLYPRMNKCNSAIAVVIGSRLR